MDSNGRTARPSRHHGGFEVLATLKPRWDCAAIVRAVTGICAASSVAQQAGSVYQFFLQRGHKAHKPRGSQRLCKLSRVRHADQDGYRRCYGWFCGPTCNIKVCLDSSWGGPEQTVCSPRFTYCGYKFSFKLSNKLRKGYISIYLKAHKARCGWPEVTFSISMTCTNRDMPQLPIEKEPEDAHAYNDEEEDWGFTQFRDIRDCKLEDTYVFTVDIMAFKPAEGAVLGLDDDLLLPVSGRPSALAQFYGNADLSDCTVYTDDGRAFPAHKLALCSASPVLKAMFTTSSSMQDASNSTVTIRDADPVTVELLLQHTYGIPELKVPVSAIVAFYKLADQYQVSAAKDSLMQAVQRTTLAEEALCRLLPQAVSLGSAAAPLTTYLASEAASCYEEILQQHDYLVNWQQADVRELIRATVASPSPCSPSKAYKCIRLGAAWALGVGQGPLGSQSLGAGPAPMAHSESAVTIPPVMQGNTQPAPVNALSRLQQWPEIHSCMRLDDLSLEEAKALHIDPLRPLVRLPGLSAAVLGIVLYKA